MTVDVKKIKSDKKLLIPAVFLIVLSFGIIAGAVILFLKRLSEAILSMPSL